MADCCNENDPSLAALREGQAQILWTVLALNALMFLGEFTAGWIADSTALLADSLDMLGDTLVYSLSLFVIAGSARAKAGAAGLKGTVMLLFGVMVAVQAVARAIYGQPPEFAIMAGVGALVLAGNIVCLTLLTRHRGDDINMSSSWTCSRNDLIANSGVIIAAALVWLFGSVWPDVIVGGLIAALFLRSSIGVLNDAVSAYRRPAVDPLQRPS